MIFFISVLYYVWTAFPEILKSDFISVTGLFAFLFHGEHAREDFSQLGFVFRSVSENGKTPFQNYQIKKVSNLLIVTKGPLEKTKLFLLVRWLKHTGVAL